MDSNTSCPITLEAIQEAMDVVRGYDPFRGDRIMRTLTLNPHRAGKPMMKCGHSANGIDAKTGNPVCVICSGIDPGAIVVDDNPPTLEGRMAKCVYCGTHKPSSTDLAFFEYMPKKAHDHFYCGCMGWD